MHIAHQVEHGADPALALHRPISPVVKTEQAGSEANAIHWGGAVTPGAARTPAHTLKNRLGATLKFKGLNLGLLLCYR